MFEKTEEKVAVTRGFEVKQLHLDSDVLRRREMYRILSHCPNLEYLEMQVSDCCASVPFNEEAARMKMSAVQAKLPWDERKYSNFKLIKVAVSAT